MSGNNLGKMPILIVTLVIGIIMATTAILPLASDYSEAKTFKNEGYYNVLYSPTDDVTVSWDHTAPKKITVNGNDYDLSSYTLDVTLVCGDNWIIRYRGSTDTISYWGSSGSALSASVANGNDLTATCIGGTLTATVGETTITDTYTDLYCIDSNGTFVMKKTDVPCYLNGDSPIYAIGITNLNGGQVAVIKFVGDIDDGVTSSCYRVNNPVFSNVNLDKTVVDSYKDLYTLNKITATVTDGNAVSTNVTYSYFIVPSEVTAEPDNPDTYKNLIKIVPLMAFIMLVVAAAAMIISKRD